ncbi:hypothetical protein [Staphylococcus hominis]|nr:hypothetical protein [Staphylococcus hominis]
MYKVFIVMPPYLLFKIISTVIIETIIAKILMIIENIYCPSF